MSITIRLVSLALLGALGVHAAGCKPEFTSKGTVTIDGRAYVPTSCQVVGTGIELTNADGARVQLTLPPARLEAWKDVSGSPSMIYTPGPGAAAIEVGRCGSLTMTGEGYHGEGKRAASGHASLSCDAAVVVSGNLTFEGCF